MLPFRLPQMPATPPMGMPVWGGPKPPGIGPGGFQGFGSDMRFAGQPPQQIGPNGSMAFGPLPMTGDRTQATRPMMGGPPLMSQEGPGSIGAPQNMTPYGHGGGFGNDSFLPGGFAGGKPVGGDRMPTPPTAATSPVSAITPPWFPGSLPSSTPAAAAHATAPRGPMLPNNTAPNYRQGDGLTLEPGQWHNPGYLSQNGTMWTQNEPGVQHQSPGYIQNGMAGTSGGMGAGGAPGYGGNGYNPMQAYIDAQNSANARNEAKFNQGNEGYSAWRQRQQDLLNGLGNQQRADTNTSFDANAGRITNSSIDRGLTNTTVMDNMLTGNERERSAALGRLNESLNRERMTQEYAPLKDQLDFIERYDINGPNPALAAQLAQNAAAAGPPGGGGGFVDMGGADYGYGGGGYGGGGMPFFGGMGPGSFIQGGGQTVGDQRLIRNNANSIMHNARMGRMGPNSPMVFGPGGGSDPAAVWGGGNPYSGGFGGFGGGFGDSLPSYPPTPMSTVPTPYVPGGGGFQSNPSVPPGLFTVNGPVGVRTPRIFGYQ